MTDALRLAVFVQRLRELGWVEGRNDVIEVRWGEGRTERLAEISDEIARLKVDVIVTHTPRPYCSQKGNIARPNCIRYGGDPSEQASSPVWPDRAVMSQGSRASTHRRGRQTT